MNTRYQALGPQALNEFVKRGAAKAHMEKRVWPYLFRHTRITDLSRSGMNDSALKKLAGWTPDSKMMAFYTHLVSADVRKAALLTYGIKTQEQPQEVKLPKKCIRCGTLCSADQEICRRCGMALTLEAPMKATEVERNREERLSRVEIMLSSIVTATISATQSANDMGRNYRKLLGAPEKQEIIELENIQASSLDGARI